jgi:hypothetical protein
MNIFSKIALGSAAGVLALAQPAIAGTRAADSLPVVTDFDRAGASLKKSENVGLGFPVLAVVAFAGIITAVIVAVADDDDDSDVSPGT